MVEPIMTAVIAAAGQGTRMYPSTKVFPKELFPLGRLPVAAHIVSELVDAGIEDIIIVGGSHNADALTALFDPSAAAPRKLADEPLVAHFESLMRRCSISIIEQVGGYGNGTPLRMAAERFRGRPCIYAFGDDVIIGENATRTLIAAYERSELTVLGAQAVPADRVSSFGILECERRGAIDYVKKIIEKPRPGQTSSNLAAFGRYVVTPAVLQALSGIVPGRDGELWFVDAILSHLLAGGEVCAAQLCGGCWYTVGDPRGYADAVRAAVEEQGIGRFERRDHNVPAPARRSQLMCD
jgi:UTP--glucose-1-phosphate uridylyltransferase